MIKLFPLAALVASLGVTAALAQPQDHTDHVHEAPAAPTTAAPAVPPVAMPGGMMACPMMASMGGGRAGMPMRQGQLPPSGAPGVATPAPAAPAMPMKSGAMPRGPNMPMAAMCMGPNGPQPVEPPKTPPAVPKE